MIADMRRYELQYNIGSDWKMFAQNLTTMAANVTLLPNTEYKFRIRGQYNTGTWTDFTPRSDSTKTLPRLASTSASQTDSHQVQLEVSFDPESAMEAVTGAKCEAAFGDGDYALSTCIDTSSDCGGLSPHVLIVNGTQRINVVVKSLYHYANYTARCQIRNSVNRSNYVYTRFTTPPDIPNQMVPVSILEQTTSTIKIQWAAPDAIPGTVSGYGGNPSKDYRYVLEVTHPDDTVVTTQLKYSSVLVYVIPDLSYNTQYEIKIAAKNSAGQGAMSPVASAKTAAQGHPWLSTVKPNIAPLHETIFVTISGSFQGREVTNCTIDDDTVRPKRSTSTEVVCPIPHVTKTRRQNHVILSKVSVSSNDEVSPDSLWIKRFDSNELQIRIADSTGASPAATGLYTGGAQTPPIRIWGNAATLDLVNESHTVNGDPLDINSVLRCRFSQSEVTETWRWAGLPGYFASCYTPSSYMPNQSATGRAGRVEVQLTLDGQTWLMSNSSYTFLCNKEDYYTPAPIHGACEACPSGGICFGNSTIRPKEGYTTVSAAVFQLCHNKAACSERQLGSTCAKHYTGPLCSMCINDYGGNFDFKCKKCDSYNQMFGIAISQGMVIACYLLYNMALSGAFSYQSIKASEADSDRFKKVHVDILIVIGMVGISYFQSMSFLSGFNFVWPAAMGHVLEFFQSFSGSFQLSMSMECIMESFDIADTAYANSVLACLLAPLCVTGIIATVMLGHCMRPLFFMICGDTNFGLEAQKRKYSLKRRLVIVVMFVTFLYQPMAVKAILMLFTCTDVGGESRLLYQMDIRCDDNSNLVGWRVAMGVCGFIYVIILPGIKFWKLVMVKDLIKAGDEETMRTYGFIVNGTQAEYYYWHLFIMMRKLSATALITLTKPYGIVVQAQLACFIFVVALCLQIKYQPFKNPIVNVLETSSIVVFLVTAWLGVLMSLPTVTEEWKVSMSVLAVLANMTYVIVLIGSCLYALWYQEGLREVIKAKLSESHRQSQESTDSVIDEKQEGEWVELSVATDVTRTSTTDDGKEIENELTPQVQSPKQDGISKCGPREMDTDQLPAMGTFGAMSVMSVDATPPEEDSGKKDPSELDHIQLKKYLKERGLAESELEVAPDKAALILLWEKHQKSAISPNNDPVIDTKEAVISL